MERIKILFVASECYPFVKTGGLGDVIGSLPKELDREKYDVRVALPFYHAVSPSWRNKAETVYYFQMDNRIYVGVKRLERDGITYYFIDNEQYFSGIVPYYDMFQDLERFAYFCKAVLSSLPLIPFRPDIIHCHDWQASLVPVYLNTIFQGDPFFVGIKTVFTIHNINFKGEWSAGHLRWVSALPSSLFTPGLLVSPYQDRSVKEDDRTATFMRGALVFSDFITTVSPSYAEEIKTPSFGEGLEDILSWRRDTLQGILNGIDYDVWNSEKDKDIYFNYGVKNRKEGKRANKREIRKALSLDENDEVFTISIISRLTAQKGLDIVDKIVDRLSSLNVSLIVLGTGDRYYENMFRYYEGKYPGRVKALIEYSESLSHKLYAASDAVLVPSAFEPCGLTQLIALRYGAIPIVHETGGLKDTVKPFNEIENKGTGFSFYDYTGYALISRIEHAERIYRERKDLWDALTERAMKEDWSWKTSAALYSTLYKNLLGMNDA